MMIKWFHTLHDSYAQFRASLRPLDALPHGTVRDTRTSAVEVGAVGCCELSFS